MALSVERVTGAGGRVYVAPTDMPGVGSFAVIADPTGGVVAPWRSARSGENEESNAPPADHRFCWDELLTTDPEAAGSFYTSVFGWGTARQDMGSMGEYTLFSRPGVKSPMDETKQAWAAGMVKAPSQVPYSFWLAYVHVADTDETARRAQDLGAEISVPPVDIPTIGRFCAFTDPQGAALAVITFAGT